MGRVFRALGLSVGKVVDHHSGPANQAALGADVTYVTSSSLAWLYLADNTSTSVSRPDQLVSDPPPPPSVGMTTKSQKVVVASRPM